MSNRVQKSEAVAIRAAKISKTALVDIMKNQSKGRFITVTWIKNGGDERTINGKVNKESFLNSLGYIKFFEKGKEIKLIEPKHIKSACINKVHYKVK